MLDKPFTICYNKDAPRGTANAKQKNLKKSKKMLDKLLRLWYNKDAPRGQQKIQKWVATYRKKGIDTMSTNTNTTHKPTKRENFNALLQIPAVASNDALVAFNTHEIELLDRKNTGEKKPTAKQIANASLAEQIVAEMEAGRLYTVSEAMKELPCLASDADMSNQRASRVMNNLVASGDLVKTTDKRKSYFSLPAEA